MSQCQQLERGQNLGSDQSIFIPPNLTGHLKRQFIWKNFSVPVGANESRVLPSRRAVKCLECGKILRKRIYFVGHFMGHYPIETADLMFHCTHPKCGRAFRTRYMLDFHMGVCRQKIMAAIVVEKKDFSPKLIRPIPVRPFVRVPFHSSTDVPFRPESPPPFTVAEKSVFSPMRLSTCMF